MRGSIKLSGCEHIARGGGVSFTTLFFKKKQIKWCRRARFRDMPLYMFTFVLKGSIQLRHQGDIKTYSENSIITEVPTMTPTEVITASEDFEAFCLMIDQNLLSQAPFINYMIRAIYFPVAELGQTGMSLSATDAHFLLRILQMINQHIDFTSDFQREALFALCQVFCIDLLHIQGKHIAQSKEPRRSPFYTVRRTGYTAFCPATQPCFLCRKT